MEAFLEGINFSLSFFGNFLGQVASQRVFALFLLLSVVGLFLDALTGSKEKK